MRQMQVSLGGLVRCASAQLKSSCATGAGYAGFWMIKLYFQTYCNKKKISEIYGFSHFATVGKNGQSVVLIYLTVNM